MKIAELERLEEVLDEPAHLLVWRRVDGFEVMAVEGEGWEDAFPLPMGVQAAAAEVGLILDTTTAARLEVEVMPDDFWEELEVVNYGEALKVSMLGRSGAKYLEVFHAVQAGGCGWAMDLRKEELLKVARWIREQAVFDRRSGDVMMEVLEELGQ